MNVIDLMVVDSIKEKVAKEIVKAKLTELEVDLAKAETNLAYSEAALRQIKLVENEPAVFADSIFSGLNTLKELEYAHGCVNADKKRVKQLESEIFKHKLRHGDNRKI